MDEDTSSSNVRLLSVAPSMWAAGGRSMNSSSSERSLLLGVISSRLSILDTRDNDSRSLRQKSILWEHITRQFNALSPTPRSRHQIQTLYKNMKAKAKKYQIRLLEARMDSFTNVLPEPDPVSELLLQLLENEQEQRRKQLKQTAISIVEGLSGREEHENKICSEMSEECNSMINNSIQTINGLIGSEMSLTEPAEETEFNDVTRKTMSSNPLSPVLISEERNEIKQERNNLSSNDVNSDDEDEMNRRPNSFPKRQKVSEETSSSTSFVSPNSNRLVDYDHMMNLFDTNLVTAVRNNNRCCCPELHSELFKMAKTEHEEKMKMFKEDQKMKQRMYEEQIKTIEIERKIYEKKLSLID